MKTLVIKGQMPGLNEIIATSGQMTQKGSMRWTKYNEVKRHWAGLIKLFARTQGFECRLGGHFTYIFREPNRRRDPSNFIAGAVKLIEDALQSEKLLNGDGWKHVESIATRWMVAEKPSVTLIVTATEPTREEIETWMT